MTPGKLRVVGLEGNANGTVVETQFNPKEVSIDKSVPWQRRKGQDAASLEFTAGEPRTMDVELLFDLFESGEPVQPEIDKIQALSDVDSALKRPPKVKVIYGAEGAPGVIPKFEGVIESVAVKYAMFNPDGVPVRATVGLKLKEARNLSVAKP